METETRYVQTIKTQLDTLFKEDENLFSIAAYRIDGTPIHFETRHANIDREFTINRLGALCRTMLWAGSDLTRHDNSQLRIITFSTTDDSKISIGFNDFFIILVETASGGNAKGIVSKLSSIWA